MSSFFKKQINAENWRLMLKKTGKTGASPLPSRLKQGIGFTPLLSFPFSAPIHTTNNWTETIFFPAEKTEKYPISKYPPKENKTSVVTEVKL